MKGDYLEEDLELLNEVTEMPPLLSKDQEAMRKVNIVQIKASLRSRKSFHDAEKSTNRFSRIIFVFTVVQIVIAFSQFSLEALLAPDKLVGTFILITCALVIYLLLKYADNHID